VPWPPRNRQDTAGTDLPAVVGELAQLLGAGVAPASAWRHGAAGTRDDPVGAVVRSAADAAASGRSVADQLDRGAREVPGRAGSDLRALAGAWRVVEVTGAPAAGILGRVAAGLRDGADVRDARTAAMAAPLATARLLAALPVLGLFLGQLMGASPVQVLLGSPPGRVSAVVGLVFAVAGAAWTRRLLRSASAPG
jgi:tight adherence protein B